MVEPEGLGAAVSWRFVLNQVSDEPCLNDLGSDALVSPPTAFRFRILLGTIFEAP